jgi:site-specific recombinase XerC
VIARFLRAAEEGRAVGGSGKRYTSAELRELRAALSHLDSEIGAMQVQAVRSRDVNALLDELRGEGLSARREAAIVEALRSLFAYAVARGLAAVIPRIEQPEPKREEPIPAVTAQPATSRRQPTPTTAMLALGTRAAGWTMWIIVIGFAVVVVALLVELA